MINLYRTVKQIVLIFMFMSVVTSCARKEQKADFDQYLLIGTYTAKESKGIHIYKFNSQTGDSEFVNEFEVENPSFQVVSNNGKFVYSVSESGNDSKVTAFAFDKKISKLTMLNAQSTDADPCHIAIDKTNRLLTVANYSGGSVSVFTVNEDGSINPATTYRFEGQGANLVRQEKPHLHNTIFSPDQRFVLANDLGTDHIYSFEVKETDDGRLTLSEAVSHSLPPETGPRHSVFHPNGQFLYMLSELSGEVFVFNYEKETGTLSQVQTILADSLKAGGSADIHITPDGNYLYASNRLKGDGLAIFSVDKETGRLAKIGYQPTDIHPRNFLITADGKFLLVANRDSNTVQLFMINSNGLLTNINKEIKLSMPVCLKLISND